MTYTLAEVRNGTGWPEGVRFTVATEPPKREPFPADGVCTNCRHDAWNYTETVMQWCPLTLDELSSGGRSWFAWFANSGDFTTADDGADAHASCAHCVTEFDLPEMDWA